MDLLLDDVHVGADDVLGEVNGGFMLARWALDGGRVGIAAQSLGVGQAALHEAIAHAQQRQTFGRLIANTRRCSGSWQTWRPSSKRPGF